jgi:hypothetical protein
MITEEQLEKEIEATKACLKYLHQQHAEEDFPELQGYLDGLIFAWRGKLD